MTWVFRLPGHVGAGCCVCCTREVEGDPTTLFVICVASGLRRGAGVGAKCSLCWGTGTELRSGIRPFPSCGVNAALPVGERLGSLLAVQRHVLYHLCVNHPISPPWQPYRGTSQNALLLPSAATSNSRLGNTFSSQKRCFLKSTFMVSSEAMHLWVASKDNGSQRVAFLGFLPYWREEQQKIRGSRRRSWRPRRTRQPTGSMRTQLLPADELNGDI